MDLKRATLYAESFVKKIAPFCDQIEIAGSIRRRSEGVKDIEIVCVPGPGVPILGFGTKVADAPRTRLDVQLLAMRESREIVLDPVNKNNGPKYKRYIHAASNMAVDLFITTAEQWGIILAIRTGDAKFSKLLVTQRSKGGLLRDGWRVKDGQLINHEGRVVPVPREQDVFTALGLPYVNPPDRGLTTAQHLHRQQSGPRAATLF